MEETAESLRVREQPQHQQNRAEAEQQQNRIRHGLLPLATKNRGQELLPSVQQKRTKGIRSGWAICAGYLEEREESGKRWEEGA